VWVATLLLHKCYTVVTLVGSEAQEEAALEDHEDSDNIQVRSH
jgi:hypothetical protein